MNQDDDNDDEAPSRELLDAMQEDTADLKTQLDLLKWRERTARDNIARIISALFDSTKEDAEKFGGNLTYAKKPLVEVLRSRLFANYTDSQIVAQHQEMFVFVDFSQRKLVILPVNEEDTEPFHVPQSELINREQRAVLFSTTNVPLVYQMSLLGAEDVSKARLQAYHTRNLSWIEKVDGTLDSVSSLLLMFRDMKIGEYFRILRLNAAQNRGATKAIGIILQREPFAFAEAEADDNDFSSLEQVDFTIAEYERQGVKFVLNLRNDYGRNRGWLPARLTWAGDEKKVATEPVKKSRRRPRARKPVPAEPAEEPPVVEGEDEPTVYYGLFERGIHQNQLLLNKLYRDVVPYINSGSFVADEVLRLTVLAYQLAFQGKSLDEIMKPISGKLADGQTVYEAKLRPTLARSIQLDTSVPLQRLPSVVSAFDALLSTTAMFFDETNTESVTPYLDEKRDARELEVQKTFYPFLFDFIWRHFLQPLGPMTLKEEKLRAIIKARSLGAIAVEDMGIVSYYNSRMAVGTDEERFDTASDFLENVIKQYAQAGKLFTPPSDTPEEKKIEFTRDFEEAHEYAQENDDPSIPLKLAELFEMLGNSSNIVYGKVPLQEYLAALAGRTADLVTVYYTLADGLFIGSDPKTAEEFKSRVFSFDPKTVGVATTTTSSTSSTTEEEDEEEEPSMPIDYKKRDPIKFATFYANLNKKI